MLYWIFDLDYTLYDLDKKIEFNYNLLNPDQELNHKLQRLPSKKFVFTNGTLWHANNCLDKLSIKSNFERIVARDTINCYKPHIVSYLKFMLLSGIYKRDKCVFFEDSLSNLLHAKQLGWITVLISPEKKNLIYVDFCFENIHKALMFFLKKISVTP